MILVSPRTDAGNWLCEPRPAVRQRRGRPIAQADCQIAAIARARGMAVATRNIRDFEDMGIDIFDPRDGA